MKFAVAVSLVAVFVAVVSANKSSKVLCERPCPMIHMPVCGSNGVTYSNECVFENALCGVPAAKAFKIAHEGACKGKRSAAPPSKGKILCVETPCPMIHAPVCGSNGVTYSNECAFENALCGVPASKNLRVVHEGPCRKAGSFKKGKARRNQQSKVLCARPCPMSYQPVCASDGTTYSNECAFENALCGVPSSKAPRIVHQGACTHEKPARSSKVSCESPCPMLLMPVCGTNGITYSNQCVFENALCGVPSNKAFKIAHEGPCKV